MLHTPIKMFLSDYFPETQETRHSQKETQSTKNLLEILSKSESYDFCQTLIFMKAEKLKNLLPALPCNLFYVCP